MSEDAESYRYPPAPPPGEGDLPDTVVDALERLAATVLDGNLDHEAARTVAATSDARLAWPIADLLRFAQSEGDRDALVAAFRGTTGVDPSGDPAFGRNAWTSVTDHAIAWDLPTPLGYRQWKAQLLLQIEPRWRPFFDDADAEVDWRWVSWGGVFIDDRPEGDNSPCSRGCIPALDHPALVSGDEGDWYPDSDTVFALVVDGEAVALPKNIMEVHEMVNLQVGSRRLGIPYCTLCGSAQAYFTDNLPEGFDDALLRTSGLLSRSNKLMYDLASGSAIDTFTGEALSGPLHDAGFTLEQTTVVTTSWAAWRAEHPDTTIVAEDGGIGLTYSPDPLEGRDDDGPIFPVGPVDPRLPVQLQVVGVIAADGTPVAFPADQAREVLADDGTVALGGVELTADAEGFRALDEGGAELASHQAFWFAWSQFHPETLLWSPL